MKRILLALTMVGFLLPLAPRAQADTEVSLNFFYDNLSSQGNWIEVADYGYAFQPNVAVSNADWRPYADGYWAYTDAGWTWVSYEDFGWATYHYGRWANLDSYGWVWVPGYEWGPAWVSWRTGGDYVGWAPLPPQGGGVVYEGRAITGEVDVTFGIGPLYYNFVDIRYIGEPVLRGRLIEPSRNVTIINTTVNVTNITYNNSIVINNGPDLNRVNQFSTRPIQRLTLQRETSVSGDFASRRGNLNRVNGTTLMVAAPAVQRSQQQLAPKQVKAKVDKPKFEKGWQGINNRQQVEQEMKKANAQNVPPPSFQPQKDRKGEAAAAGQNAGAQPNEGAPAQPGPGAVKDQEAAKTARGAQLDGRDQNAGQPRENRNAEQAAAQEKQKNAREHRTQQADQQNADRAQQMQERKAHQDEQRQQQQERAQQPTSEKAGQDRPEKRAQEVQAQQPDRGAQRAEQAQEAQRAARARNAAPAQESVRANRAQQTQEAQPAERAQRSERPSRPERVERPQPQENQDPNAEHKGKKKKPGEEPTPQP